MKKLIIFLAIMLIAAPAFCATLSWDASIGAESYEVRYRAVGASNWLPQPPVTVTTFDIDTLPLVPGTRYEFQVFAMAAGSYSGPSDILRWTLEQPPIIVEIFESVKQFILNP